MATEIFRATCADSESKMAEVLTLQVVKARIKLALEQSRPVSRRLNILPDFSLTRITVLHVEAICYKGLRMLVPHTPQLRCLEASLPGEARSVFAIVAGIPTIRLLHLSQYPNTGSHSIQASDFRLLADGCPQIGGSYAWQHSEYFFFGQPTLPMTISSTWYRGLEPLRSFTLQLSCSSCFI